MKSLSKQNGMSSLVLLFLLSSVGFFVLCAFKLVPAYAENRYIEEALKSLGEEGSALPDMTKGQIRKKLNKFYMVNNVRSKGAQEIKVERTSKSTIVHVDYEVRTPLFLNIEIVVSFENYLDSSRPLECCRPPIKLGKSE